MQGVIKWCCWTLVHGVSLRWQVTLTDIERCRICFNKLVLLLLNYCCCCCLLLNYVNYEWLECPKNEWPNGLITNTRLMTLFPGLPRSASTRKVKPIWILLKQETVSGSGKYASRSRQITMPVPHLFKFFYRLDALPAAQPTVSKHWRQTNGLITCNNFNDDNIL